jgi:thioredoxin 1
MAVQISDATFETEVISNEKLTVVDFWAEWCGPCKMMNPILEQLSQDYGDKVSIAKLNIDDNSETPTQFNVRAIPTMIFFKGGAEVGRMVGAQTIQSMKTQIDRLLN